ncbi:hypothetical protein TKK_0003515 [Trichogramma kaykai]
MIRKKWCVGIGTLVALALIVALTLALTLRSNKEGKFISDAPLGVFHKAAVSTLGMECAEIGSDILKRNGSAVDAAIAALLCEGIASPHSMGLGGGFLMTIYDAESNQVSFLDARETAPAAANETMFNGDGNKSLYGGLGIAIPGELKGYWEAHQRYGKLPWKDLFQGSIKLCETGAEVNQYLFNSIRGKEKFILNEPTLSDVFIDPKTNRTWTVGKHIKRPVLAKTLQQLAESDDPVGLFYNGSMAKDLVAEIQSYDGIITLDDMKNYEVKWREPLKAKLGNATIYTAPPPGSGALLSFIINVMDGFGKIDDVDLFYQRLIETFKWAYAKRTELGDQDFVPAVHDLLANLSSVEFANEIRSLIQDNTTNLDPEYYGADFSNKETHGTSHVSILAPDGSAVSVTSTINQILGAKIRSKSTGIIFNDEMDDFSSPNITNGFDLPPSPRNYIKPGKRPLSSMTPTIVMDDKNKVQMVIGAAGGSKITTAVASIILQNMRYNFDIKEAVDEPRLHHQLFPMAIQTEKNFSPTILEFLRRIGHSITTFEGIGTAVTAIERDGDKILANSDYRRQGKIAGF